MELDPVLLARLQFAFTISFHIIFPSFTIGLSAYIATLEVLWGATGAERYKRLAAFWTKIFAVSFGMGVVSGIVLSYQLGTNWSRFSAVAGNVIGPLAGYEVLTAFFLEATFLGILLFGGSRVPRWLHVFSAIAVAVGTTISAFWILAANSWMHTPAGHEMRGGVAYATDWLAIIFNPSFIYRFAHMLNAAFLTTGFVVLAVGARHLLANRHAEEARTMMRMALGLTAVLAPLQLFLGDQHGLNTLEHQPIKVAAMEAHWDGSKPGDFHVFAWPDEKGERNWFEISIPRGSSLILTHDPNGLFPGLKSVPPQERPPIVPVFFAFRIMLGIGFFMIAAALYGAWLMWRGTLERTRWYLYVVANTWWVGFVAVIAGWIVTETGRQPWIVHGILRTADAVSPVPGGSIATTLTLFVLVYGVVFSLGIYYINRLIAKGPEDREGSGSLGHRPLAAGHRQKAVPT
ncbi:MAG: cytochrome ubiquinol oxidase subunit I [Xanthobacteraceae bacterium]